MVTEHMVWSEIKLEAFSCSMYLSLTVMAD